ncbi:hypothetical protein Tco_0872216 [Tanacetum coccineum]
MPPRRFKKKAVKRIVEKRVAKAIEKYEKTKAISTILVDSDQQILEELFDKPRCMMFVKDIYERKKKKMVNTHHKEFLNASTSKGAEPSASDAEHDDNDNGSSSGSEGLNYRGFTEEETKALRSMINKQLGKEIKNVMFDGALDPIASTRWLVAVEGAFRSSNCKKKNKVNFAPNFLRDNAKMWWEGKVCEKGEEWIRACTWKEFKELFNA